jgi:hypothetical protein
MTWTVREVIPRFPGMLAGGISKLLLDSILANARSIRHQLFMGPFWSVEHRKVGLI